MRDKRDDIYSFGCNFRDSIYFHSLRYYSSITSDLDLILLSMDNIRDFIGDARF